MFIVITIFRFTSAQAILKYSRQGRTPLLVRLLARLPFLAPHAQELEALALDMNVRTWVA